MMKYHIVILRRTSCAFSQPLDAFWLQLEAIHTGDVADHGESIIFSLKPYSAFKHNAQLSTLAAAKLTSYLYSSTDSDATLLTTCINASSSICRPTECRQYRPYPPLLYQPRSCFYDRQTSDPASPISWRRDLIHVPASVQYKGRDFLLQCSTATPELISQPKYAKRSRQIRDFFNLKIQARSVQVHTRKSRHLISGVFSTTLSL